MGADRSRRRTSTYGALGGCLAALLIIGASLPASSADGQGSLGSSCAHPWQAIYQVGGPGGGFEGDQTHIHMSGTPRLLNWVADRPRSVICSVRIHLANGRWVEPTRLYPYATPTPTGGEYKAPHAPLRTAIVTAARSPVPLGANCNYPVYSIQSVDGAPSNGSDTKDYSVNVKIVRNPNPGSTQPMRLHLEITIHNPRAIICRAFITVFPPNAQGFIRDETAEIYPVIVSPGGTVTSDDIEVPSNCAFAGAVYARLR